MSWSLRTSAGGSALLALALLLGPGAPPAARAQESIEARYKKAMDLFNSAQMEDACELFRAIEKEKAGYSQTRTYLNISCKEADRIRKLEESMFDEGVQLFNQGRYEDAQQKLKQAASIPLKNPRFRDQIKKYLSDIDARLGEDKLFAEGVKLFNEGNDTEARARFNQVVKAGGPKAADARAYLQRIQERREESAYAEGVRLFNSGDLAAARSRLQEVVGLNGKRRPEAERTLSQIDQAEREQSAFANAVRAFEQRRYDDARTGFQEVVGLNGNRKTEAQRYLGRIDAAAAEESAFREAVRKFDQKDFEGARADFQKVINLRGDRATEARVYLTRITAQGKDPKLVAQQFVADAQAAMDRKNYRAAVEKLQAATALDPANREARRLLSQSQGLAEEQPLRSGLRAYFQGEYEEAERELSTYLDNKGSKRALAQFFRGAVRGARYFLSGEKDARQKQLALDDFRSLRKDFARFQPPEKYISPKILTLFSEAAGASAP